jgi:[CysO sulfur-carrier protein]-S-L-cysteine hydrolase
MGHVIRLPRLIFSQIVVQAYDQQPRECCGVLSGHAGQALTIHPLENKSPEPEKRYFAAPEDLFAAMRNMRTANEDLIAIYHSHPRGPAIPSQTDIDLAFYSQAIYLIVSLQPDIEMKAFTISEENAIETEIIVLD